MTVRTLDDGPRYFNNHAVGVSINQRLSLALLLAALAVFTGCAGISAGPQSNPANNLPTLNTSTVAVNFGSISLGSSKTSSVTVSDSQNSTAAITITNVSVSGSGFSLSSPPVMPATLNPGQTLSLTVAFAPISAGSATGTLTITSNTENVSAAIPLSGTGLTAGQLGVNPTTINFGSIAVGGSSTQSASLTAGTSDVTVSTASWNGEGFSVTGITFPVTVPAGQSVSFQVQFAPQIVGLSSGSISFISNAADSPTVQTVTGTGTQASAHSVDLSWAASTSVVVGYNLYRGTQAGGPYSKLTSSPQPSTSYTDASVTAGTTYYYVATAVDGKSVESSYSNEVQAVVPTP
jgi:hypothetical protein